MAKSLTGAEQNSLSGGFPCTILPVSLVEKGTFSGTSESMSPLTNTGVG